MSGQPEAWRLEEELRAARGELKAVKDELASVKAERDRKAAELEAADGDLRNLFLSSQVAAVFLDQDLRIKRYTPGAASLLGVSESDEKLSTEYLGSRFSGYDLVGDIREVMRTLAGAERQMQLDGGRCWLVVRILPYWTKGNTVAGVVLTFADVTALKRAEERSQQSEELLRVVFNSVYDSILIHDLGGRVLDVNEPCLRLYGMSREQALRTTIGDLSGEGMSMARASAIWAKVMAGSPQFFEWRARRICDGKEFDAEVFLKQVRLGGQEMIVANVRDVTARKQAEETQRQSERLLRLLMDLVPLGVWAKDASGRFIFANRTIAEYSARSPEQMTGRLDIEMARDRSQAEAFRKDDLEVLKSGRPKFIAEERLLDATGRARVLQTTKVPFIVPQTGLPAVLGVAMDITERKLAEEALRESEARFHALFDWSPTGMMLIDPEGAGVLDCNEVAAESLGYTRDELRRMYVPDFESQLGAAGLEAMRASVLGGQPTRFDTVLRRKGGELRDFAVSVAKVMVSGRALLYAALIDITERKRAESERLEMEKRLLHAQKLESLGIMAGGIAHDFNNLLMAMLANLHLALQDFGVGASSRRGVEEAVKAARRAADLTRQMLAYSGKGKFIYARVDVGALVRENAGLFEAVVPKAISMRVEIAEDLPVVEADVGQVQQVIMNLITNASEAIGENEGRIELRVRVRECDEEYLSRTRLEEKAQPGRYVCLEVSDTGCGMDEWTQERLFEPFFTTKFKGRGLGMAAALGIVKAHHGALIVNSVVGEGTRIEVLFPACEEGEEAGTGTAVEAGEASERGKEVVFGGKVLVVDDEAAVRDVCQIMLESLGFAVLTAADGQEAIRVFREQSEEIVCVILDMSMPWLDGRRTLEELKRIRPEARVLLSSGHGEQEAKELLEAKKVGFIQKPYMSEDLRRALGQLLGSVV